MSLDFKIVYSYIKLTKNAINLNTIILLWGEYRCKHLLVIVNELLIIFHKKINDNFQEFEFIHTLIKGLLISTKGYCKYHVQILEFILLIQKNVNNF